MTKKPKFGKIFIVVFLTVLIWVWADLAQDEPLTLRNFVTISVSRSSGSMLWVNFVVGAEQRLENKVTLDSVELTGPASRVADARRMQNEGEFEGDLFLEPDQANMTESGTRTWDVLNFLKQSREIDQLGLTVEGCEPRTLTVQVVKLVTKPQIRVEVIDQNGNLIRDANVEPPTVTGTVPEDWTSPAKVELSEADQNQAKAARIDRMPYVELAPGQRQTLSTPVKISLPPEQIMLTERPVLQPTLGFVFSPVLQGKYRVELQDEAELQSSVFVNATLAAFTAYTNQLYKIHLNILDADKDATGDLVREVEFNLPEEYVRRGEIERAPDREVPKARFRVVSVYEEMQEAP